MNVIPDQAFDIAWEEHILSDIARTTSGGTPNRSTKEYFQGTIPWVKSGELDDNFILDTEEKITQQALDNSSAKLFPAGTLLIAMYGATVGKTSILKIDAATNQAICGIFPDASRVDTDFLRYQLIHFRPQLLSQRHGGAQPNVSQTIIKNIPVRLPSLDEQRRIAHVLSTVQTAIEQQARLIALTSQLKSALLHKLFTEGLRGEKQKQTEIGLVPESWRITKLGDVCSIATGTTPATGREDYYGGDIPFVRTSEIANCRIDSAETYVTQKAVEECRLKIYPPNTVFMAMYGQGKTRGQVAILDIPATTSQNTAAIICGESIDPDFLWHWLMSRYDNLRNAGALGHLSHLNLGYVKAYEIALPPIKEQKEIAQILNVMGNKLGYAERKEALLT